MEQLKTHCNRLGVPLFDRGYDKDPTNVAAEAIKQAKRDGIDVVLVDTAGRMQDNEPLMHALSMLINKNTPDLVLFVGEALVGNDGVCLVLWGVTLRRIWSWYELSCTRLVATGGHHLCCVCIPALNSCATP